MTKNLNSLSDTELVSDVKKLVSEEKRLVVEILHYLGEVRRRRLYALYGYSSLFEFCVKFLGYTEAQTQRRISAMKAAAELPEIDEKLKDGSLTLTAVAQAQSFFNSQFKAQKPLSLESKQEVLKTLENKSTRECEKELLRLSEVAPIPKEKVKPVSETHTQTTTTYPNEVLQKLERIKSLLSHKNPRMSQADLINEMAEIVLNNIDPLRKREKSVKTKNSLVAPQVKREAVFRKYEGQCSFVSPITNKRCESKYFLEVDHIKPKALGGTLEPTNTRLLCRGHNQRAAIEAFGLQKMNPYLNKPDSATNEKARYF